MGYVIRITIRFLDLFTKLVRKNLNKIYVEVFKIPQLHIKTKLKMYYSSLMKKKI